MVLKKASWCVAESCGRGAHASRASWVCCGSKSPSCQLVRTGALEVVLYGLHLVPPRAMPHLLSPFLWVSGHQQASQARHTRERSCAKDRVRSSGPVRESWQRSCNRHTNHQDNIFNT